MLISLVTFIFEFQLQYVQIRYVGTWKQELSKQDTDSFQKDSILHETIFVFIYKYLNLNNLQHYAMFGCTFISLTQNAHCICLRKQSTDTNRRTSIMQ